MQKDRHTPLRPLQTPLHVTTHSDTTTTIWHGRGMVGDILETVGPWECNLEEMVGEVGILLCERENSIVILQEIIIDMCCILNSWTTGLPTLGIFWEPKMLVMIVSHPIIYEGCIRSRSKNSKGPAKRMLVCVCSSAGANLFWELHYEGAGVQCVFTCVGN